MQKSVYERHGGFGFVVPLVPVVHRMFTESNELKAMLSGRSMEDLIEAYVKLFFLILEGPTTDNKEALLKSFKVFKIDESKFEEIKRIMRILLTSTDLSEQESQKAMKVLEAHKEQLLAG